ncbi:MAG: histidine kinase [Ignavibacteriaceae bacterium]|nr:histidine kinase [Ignavibacteria bacterium]NNJ53655.1 histidine kinase [Ignavibacteriaceae bacterium]
MIKLIYNLVVMVIISPFLIAQQTVSIEIIVLCDSLNYNSEIFITGNDPQLGNWQPDKTKLIKIENGKWRKKFFFTKGKKLEFKVTRGSWETEVLNDDGSVPSNHCLILEKDTSVTITVNLWADQFEVTLKGQITGIVKYHSNIKAPELKRREVIVWLPPFYFLETAKRYPVLYMHDGQNLFDPSTSAFRVDWQLDETVDSLIRKKLIEDIIIVGIYNSSERSSEYSENDTGYAYINFIIDSLKPFIDARYRTLTGKENTAVGGSSLAGLISFMMVWEFSNYFSKAICISPALKIERFDFVDNVKSYNGDKKNIKIYIDNGGVGTDSILQAGINEMLLVLKEKDFIVGDDVFWFRDEDAQHSESEWSKRVWRALIFLFGTEEGKKLLAGF